MIRVTKTVSLVLYICLMLCMIAACASAEDSVGQPTDKNPNFHPGDRPPGGNNTPPDFANNTEFRDRMVKDLESKGVDTTDLKAAFESGDREKIGSVMDSLRDKLPQPPQNGTPGEMGKPGREGNPQGMPADIATPSKESEDNAKPEPAATQSPVSPFTILASIGAAAGVTICIRR